MGIGAGVDKLSIDPDPVALALDAAFNHMRDSELPADLTQVARADSFVCITLVRLMTLRSATLARSERISS